MTTNTESRKPLMGIKLEGQAEPVVLLEPSECSGFSDCLDDGRHAECGAVLLGFGAVLAACACSCHGFGEGGHTAPTMPPIDSGAAGDSRR